MYTVLTLMCLPSLVCGCAMHACLCQPPHRVCCACECIDAAAARCAGMCSTAGDVCRRGYCAGASCAQLAAAERVPITAIVCRPSRLGSTSFAASWPPSKGHDELHAGDAAVAAGTRPLTTHKRAACILWRMQCSATTVGGMLVGAVRWTAGRATCTYTPSSGVGKRLCCRQCPLLTFPRARIVLVRTPLCSHVCAHHVRCCEC